MKIPNLRWWLCLLLFGATALSFLDRQVLSVVAPVVTEEFHMSNEAYSHVTTAFLISYAIMFALMGKIMDRVGTRLGMLLSVGIWSIASALHAVARTPFELGLFRTFLGVGEGGCFPGAAKAVAEWFPARERALAVGVAIGGASLGGVVAPPLTVWLVHTFGWRGAFVASGCFGAIWLLLWWIFYYLPDKSPWLGDRERAMLQDESPAAAAMESNTSESTSTKDKTPAASSLSFLELLQQRNVLGLSLVRFVVDPVFYFYMFWIPKYLHQERGVSLDEIGRLAWVPFFTLGLSNIAGGWISDRLIAAGYSPSMARRSVMAVAAVVTIASGLTPLAGGAVAAVCLMGVLMFAHGFWITNYVTIISELFEKNTVATVMGITGAIGTVGGMIANTAVGLVADRFSFTPIWIASGCLYPIAFVLLLATVRSPKPLAK